MNDQKNTDNEIALVNEGSMEECERHFQKNALSMDGARFLIMSRNCAKILLYARYRTFDSFNEVELVKLNIEELVTGYLSLRRFLWKDAEVALIESNMREAIKLALTYSALSEEGEVALLRKKDFELIELYEKTWGLWSREAKNLRIRM